MAYTELCLTIATLVSRFDFELYETGIRHMKIKHDFFVAVPELESKGVSATVKEHSLPATTATTTKSGRTRRLERGISMPDPANAALVQVADENSEIDGTEGDGGQVESTMKAITAVELATKALNEAAAKG